MIEENLFSPQQLINLLNIINDLIAKNLENYNQLNNHSNILIQNYYDSLPDNEKPIKRSYFPRNEFDINIFTLIKKITEILINENYSFVFDATHLIDAKEELENISNNYTNNFKSIFLNSQINDIISNNKYNKKEIEEQNLAFFKQIEQALFNTQKILTHTFQEISLITHAQDEFLKKISPVYNEYKDKYNLLSDSIEQLFDEIKDKDKKFSYALDSENNSELKELYLNISRSEEAKADKYRYYALIIFFFVGILVFGIVCSSIIQSYLHLINPKKYNDLEFGMSYLTRIIGLLSITLPAWYLTKESSRHRLVSYKARILGTELRAFPHYVNELSTEQRNELRVKLIDKFFGQELYKENNKADSTDLNEQTKATTEALKLVTTALSSSKTIQK